MSTGREIRLTEDDDWWVAHDVETGVASQGKTREEALEMLDEAVALHRGEAGRPVTEDDLEEWGLNPDEVDLTAEPSTPDAPWFGDE